MKTNFVDFGIIVALRIERDALLEKFKEHKKIQDVSLSYRTFYLCRCGEYTIILTLLLRMGNLEAQGATNEILRVWKPNYVLVVGLAGGNIEKSVNIGDIVVSDSIIYYEIAKYKEEGIEVRPRTYAVDSLLLDRIENTSLNYEIHVGPIASGEKVVADNDFRKKILQVQPDLIAFEMESAGAARACQDTTVGFITIRGISDSADPRKKDNYRTQATRNVANFFASWIEESPVRSISSSMDLANVYNEVKNSHSAVKTKEMTQEDKEAVEERLEKYSQIVVSDFKNKLPFPSLRQKISRVEIDNNYGILEIESLSFEDFLEKSKSDDLVAVVGHSGYGKTTLLRKKFINVRKRGEKYPIWLEISELLLCGPIKSIVKAASIRFIDNQKMESFFEKAIENGDFEIIIDDFHLWYITGEKKKQVYNEIETYLKYYLSRGNKITISCLSFSEVMCDLQNLIPSTYNINLPDKTEVYDILKKSYSSLIPTQNIDKSIGILRIPILFSIYLKLHQKIKVTISNLLTLYINKEIDRIDDTPDKQKTLHIRDLLNNLAIKLKEEGGNYFKESDIKALGIKKLGDEDISRLLDSSIFTPTYSRTYQFLHGYVQDYLVGLKINDDFKRYWNHFRENPKYWSQSIIFAIGILSEISAKRAIEKINSLLALYDKSKDLEYLYYSIFCSSEIPNSEQLEHKILDKIINSIEEVEDNNFYNWLPEIMNSVQMLQWKKLNIAFAGYLLEKINKKQLVPKMLNLVHYSPSILSESKELQTLLAEYLKHIKEGKEVDYHLFFTILEAFYVAGVDKALPLLDLYSINNPISKAQIIFIAESRGQSGFNFNQEKQKLKAEIEKFFCDPDPFIVGHAIYESIRLDCEYFKEKIAQVISKRKDPILKYHTLYGVRFVGPECRDWLTNAIEISYKESNND